ncbi:MAG: twin-arginine translocase TatA/TatE family subunit [Croceibacterium sp.]
MNIGPFQLLIIALIVLLLFGRGRIGQSLGEFGHGVKAFRRGLGEANQAPPLVIDGQASDAAQPDTAIPADK